jgi:hypothetical protein
MSQTPEQEQRRREHLATLLVLLVILGEILAVVFCAWALNYLGVI